MLGVPAPTLGAQDLRFSVVDIALTHQVALGQCGIQRQALGEVSPTGIGGAPPARRSSRASEARTTMTWGVADLALQPGAVLDHAGSFAVQFVDQEFAARHLVGLVGGGQLVAEGDPVGCGIRAARADELPEFLGLRFGTGCGDHHCDDDLAPLGVLGTDRAI